MNKTIGNKVVSHCPVCTAESLQVYHQDKYRIYLQCVTCSFIFVPSDYHLTADEEKQIYDQHKNAIYDQGYRRFLSRVVEPLVPKLAANGQGLDFGCGPGPALAAMLEERGFGVNKYDLFYYPDKSVLNQTYDFITATEVIEHLADPLHYIKLWLGMLKPGGWLGLMTKLVTNQQAFTHWHYIRDLTHISFFSPPVFEYLSTCLPISFEIIGSDVILVQKKRTMDTKPK
ncbi:class I SAM-dependent methyltransferase [Zooshikella ganghwensis]|uniref:Class I SAM-dependent methyltransferase n=1 Tax=Zooshikella ganghwensis TaxID=202772 RepID=A0A4P9VNE7_9GAMM|nr:class I SAM-dependent methyltransferase [Zooshikella ganghwensis]RDH43977.1 class I SAM-dependent methyltransferase [Zooshikella ganghwensis]